MGKTVGTAAFLAKGAAVRCGTCGGSSRPGASYCAGCGRPLLAALETRPSRPADFYSHDPMRAVEAQKSYFKQFGGGA
jgi:hypothetical protein